MTIFFYEINNYGTLVNGDFPKVITSSYPEIAGHSAETELIVNVKYFQVYFRKLSVLHGCQATGFHY